LIAARDLEGLFAKKRKRIASLREGKEAILTKNLRTSGPVTA
jgi:hypothetical protein